MGTFKIVNYYRCTPRFIWCLDCLSYFQKYVLSKTSKGGFLFLLYFKLENKMQEELDIPDSDRSRISGNDIVLVSRVEC